MSLLKSYRVDTQESIQSRYTRVDSESYTNLHKKQNLSLTSTKTAAISAYAHSVNRLEMHCGRAELLSPSVMLCLFLTRLSKTLLNVFDTRSHHVLTTAQRMLAGSFLMKQGPSCAGSSDSLLRAAAKQSTLHFQISKESLKLFIMFQREKMSKKYPFKYEDKQEMANAATFSKKHISQTTHALETVRCSQQNSSQSFLDKITLLLQYIMIFH